MEEIKSWLENPSAIHSEGIAILAKYSKNRVLSNSLGRRETDYNKSKLRYELAKLASVDLSNLSQAEQPLASESADNKELLQVNKGLQKETDAPDLFKQKADLWNERAQLSNKLAETSDEELPALSAQILALDEAIKEVDSRIEQLDKPTTPEEQANLKLTIEEVTKQRDNARSRVSKALLKVKKNPGNTEYQANLAKQEATREEWDLKLKALTIQCN